MKHLKIHLSIFTLLFSFAALAQDKSSFDKYFEERAKGDAAAVDSRAEFARHVCQAAITTFCPGFTPDPKKPCSEEQKKCGSPITIVEKRFISKYGVGLTSAQRDTLPTMKRIFQVMKELELQKQQHQKALSPAVKGRFTYLMKTTELKATEVAQRIFAFSNKYFPKKLQTIYIDYWGYFQQQVPPRPEFRLNEGSGTADLRVSFRWCADKKRFIDESNHLVGDVLASAIMDPSDIPNFISADTFQKKCDSLPVEHGDKVTK